jgi:deoxyribodipyrimidine photo-lyase
MIRYSWLMTGSVSSLVWLRRDLRLHDHAALHEALQAEGPVQPVFIFDTTILARFSNPKDRRIHFLVQTLLHLHRQLKAQGGGLIIAYGHAEMLIPELAKRLKVKQVICEEDYEPGTQARDHSVRQALQGTARFVQVVDHIVHPPLQVLKDDGTPYKVFTPYSNAWRSRLTKQSFAEKPVSLQGRLADHVALVQAPGECEHGHLLDADGEAAAMLEAMGYQPAELGEWQVNDAAKRLRRFADHHLINYSEQRDVPAIEGTSKLSPYLRFGLVSIRECARAAAAQESKGSDVWLKELIWREFYTMILYHFPDTVHTEFLPIYRGLKWDQDRELFQRWQNGMTGYPIIDAAMRQLRDTGWMHNRARMIVASFLTKDLHIDWRLGEEHFAQYLMDYELASNVGGWQWAASTGTDAQPYFRIFNPELQSLKFDPNGDYIRRFVPELAKLNEKSIHTPLKYKDLFAATTYPAPIVDHHEEKEKAVAMFKAMK